jgi:hypothetical protein
MPDQEESADQATAHPVQQQLVRATTASQAIRWIRGAVWTVVLSLDPDPVDGVLSWIRWGYINDVEDLIRNQPCAVDISYADTYIGWTARPALFLPMFYPVKA